MRVFETGERLVRILEGLVTAFTSSHGPRESAASYVTLTEPLGFERLRKHNRAGTNQHQRPNPFPLLPSPQPHRHIAPLRIRPPPINNASPCVIV